ACLSLFRYRALFYVCSFFVSQHRGPQARHSFPTRRSSDLIDLPVLIDDDEFALVAFGEDVAVLIQGRPESQCAVGCLLESLDERSEEHTSELQSLRHLVCRLLLEKKNKTTKSHGHYRSTPK